MTCGLDWNLSVCVWRNDMWKCSRTKVLCFSHGQDLGFWLHWVLNAGWRKRTLKHFRYQCMCLKKWYLKSFLAPNCLDSVKILGLDLALIIWWGIYFLWLGWGEKMMKPVLGGSWLSWRSSGSIEWFQFWFFTHKRNLESGFRSNSSKNQTLVLIVGKSDLVLRTVTSG